MCRRETSGKGEEGESSFYARGGQPPTRISNATCHRCRPEWLAIWLPALLIDLRAGLGRKRGGLSRCAQLTRPRALAAGHADAQLHGLDGGALVDETEHLAVAVVERPFHSRPEVAAQLERLPGVAQIDLHVGLHCTGEQA